MKRFIRTLVTVLMAALILASIIWYLFDYDRNFTRDMLLKQARYHDLHGSSRISSLFYNLAYQYSGQDQNVAIELANQYIDDGNYTKAEVTLTNAINSGATVELYTALSRTYIEQDKILDAISLLTYINDPVLKAQVDLLRPTAPESDFQPGFYSQYINVALKSSSDRIYSTIDGDYPSVVEDLYTEPISLPVGETRICAVSVSEDGLVSPMTFLGYTVGGIVEPAVFTDPAIEAAARDILDNHSEKPLYTNELWEIKEFTLPADATSLNDLALMPYLESFSIRNKELETLSALSSLSKLQKLDLSGCRFPVSELSVIAALPDLTDLTLSECGLSTIADISGAKHLTRLVLNGNTIRNLEPLSEMTTLKELNLSHNALTQLDALSTLTALENLDISYNSVTSMAPLSSCIKLSSVSAGNNSIDSVKGVNALSLLTKLALDYNKLANVSELSECVTLTELSISNNKISDISALSTLVNLESFDFSYNNVEALPKWHAESALRMIDGSHNSLKSIDVLKKTENITYIYMDYNAITNIDALAKCYHLVQVNVYGNSIADVSELTAHNIIVNYNPTAEASDQS